MFRSPSKSLTNCTICGKISKPAELTIEPAARNAPYAGDSPNAGSKYAEIATTVLTHIMELIILSWS